MIPGLEQLFSRTHEQESTFDCTKSLCATAVRVAYYEARLSTELQTLWLRNNYPNLKNQARKRSGYNTHISVSRLSNISRLIGPHLKKKLLSTPENG